MSDISVPISIKQGTTYKMMVHMKTQSNPMPLDGMTFEGVIKQSVYDSDTYAFPFRFEVIDALSGDLMVLLDPDISQKIDFTSGVYNCHYSTSPTERYRFLEGTVAVDLEV